MVWYTLAVVAFSLFAGIGIKSVVDRIWPPPLYRGPDEPERFPEPVGRHSYVTDNTMDVLADGFQAGERSARTWRLQEELRGHPGEAQPGGGWMDGPMLGPGFSGDLTGSAAEPNGSKQGWEGLS